MGCTGLRAAKITLIVINVLSIIGSIILIVAAGVYFSSQPDTNNENAGTAAAALGVVIFIAVCQIILSCIGIWGAAKEHLCMLQTYVGIVAVCFIILVVLFFVGLANSSNSGNGNSIGSSIFTIIVQLAGLCLAIYVVREVKKNHTSGRVLA